MVVQQSTRQMLGVFVSTLTAVVVGCCIYFFLNYFWDFWHVGEVLGILLGIFIGIVTGFTVYLTGWRKTDLNTVAVLLSWGRAAGDIFGPGLRWYAPWESCKNVPDSTKKFILAMDGERINAQDGALIFFGIAENEKGGKVNELQYSIVDPVLRIGVDNLKMELRTAYLEEARLFFGQAVAAVGVKNEKTLFSDFLMLEPDLRRKNPGFTIDDNPSFLAFKRRLEKARFIRSDDEAQGPQPERLYIDDAVTAIMEKAGTFLDKCAKWGVGNVVAFTPNVRENPATEAAAALKQVAIEETVAFNTKADAVTAKAKGMIEAGVSPDFAATLATKIQGEDVKIEHRTVTYSGLPEAIGTVTDKVIAAFVPKKDEPKPKGGHRWQPPQPLGVNRRQ